MLEAKIKELGGKLTVIGGDLEEGKSQIGVYIAAMISKGAAKRRAALVIGP